MSISTQTASTAAESFESLLNESLAGDNLIGTVVKGTIIDLGSDYALVDVGLKSEGRVQLREFGADAVKLKVGDLVDVYLDRMEGRDGTTVLSRDKARREAAWVTLEESFAKGERVTGSIFGRVKGGFTVDLSGAMAFLPGSQVDVRPIRDIDSLMGVEQPFQILKMDRSRGNIVVSRRAILEESRSEARGEILSKLEEGQVLDGVVKNITDYGAFVDLGGIDGLLHVTDISWQRVNHPSDVLTPGQELKVQVVRFNKETQRISLGLKQLEKDPWAEVGDKFQTGTRHKGTVTNITDYGAFVALDGGIEGLVHVSEMSWTKKSVHPNRLVSQGQEVEVEVLESDPEKRRIALGIKQCQSNPWDTLKERFPVGSEVEGEIRNVTEFGLFVGLTEDIDGMAHMSDLSWDQSGDDAIANYRKGDTIKVKVLDIDSDRERVVLGVKQLSSDPFAESLEGLKRGVVVTCEVTALQDDGIVVSLPDANGLEGFIRRAELSQDRNERRMDRFAVGEKIDAQITSIDKSNRSIQLSIKARESTEEKEAVAKYGSTDSGASLGDILGAALEKKKEDAKPAESPKAEKPKKAAPKKAEKEADSEEAKAAPKKKAPAKKAAAKKEEESK
ncbi:MAG: 30S ribosomal protein S1 [bacterium]|nr:30S ribosomal protein S1 [bacterium]